MAPINAATPYHYCPPPTPHPYPLCTSLAVGDPSNPSPQQVAGGSRDGGNRPNPLAEEEAPTPVPPPPSHSIRPAASAIRPPPPHRRRRRVRGSPHPGAAAAAWGSVNGSVKILTENHASRSASASGGCAGACRRRPGGRGACYCRRRRGCC